MKKILLIACAVGTLTSLPAHSWSEKACRAYEFAELNTFSNDQLAELAAKYTGIYRQIGTITPENAREVQEDFSDKQNCSEETQRINRILDSRKTQKVIKKAK